MEWLDLSAKMGKDADGVVGSFSLVGNACLIAFCVLPEVLLLTLYFSPIPHPLLIYYIIMILAPTVFIITSGSLNAYARIFRHEAGRFSKGTIARAGVAFMLGFVFQNIANLVVAHHTEWGLWRSAVWKLPGNLFFEFVNPMMETFFWRIFLHREMAVRFFPAKTDPGDELIMLSTRMPAIPRLSKLGMWVNGLAFGLYHYVPLVIFDLPLYASVGITYWMMISFIAYLCIFGVGTVYIREHRHGGIIAALMLHCGLDAENILSYTLIMDMRGRTGLNLIGYRHAWAP